MNFRRSGFRVVVVEDEAALSTLLEGAGYQVQAYSSFAQLLEGYEVSEPTCVVLKLRSGRPGGLDCRNSRVAVLGGQLFAQMVREIRNGDVGGSAEPRAADDLLHRVAKALAVDARNHEQMLRREQARQRLATLSRGEREVLDFLVAGTTHKIISKELDIAVRTVERRRKRILTKLHAESLAQVLKMVLEVESDVGC